MLLIVSNLAIEVLFILVGIPFLHAISSLELHDNFKKITAIENYQVCKAARTRKPASSGDEISIEPRELDLVIPAGEVAYLDQSMNVNTLTINGQLICDEKNADATIEIKAKTIYVNGIFRCGTASNPYDKKLIISLKHSNIDAKADASYRGIIVNNGAELSLHGNRNKAGWVKLAQTAMPGDQSLIIRPKYSMFDLMVPVKSSYDRQTSLMRTQVQRPHSGWEVGDKIALAPTGFNYAEAEDFTITGIDPSNPYKIYLDKPLQYMHWGEKSEYQSSVFGKIILDEGAEVANLTRSILIRADERSFEIDEGNGAQAQRGGHVMTHYGSVAHIDGVEFYKMGQAGIMARYPFHWHYVGDAPGQFIKNSSIHHSYQRCITVHRTNKVLVQNNVCYNFKGHGIFLEDGTEQDNQIIRNLTILAKAPTANKLLLASDDVLHSETQGRFPSVSGIWISHPNNYVVNNTVAGSVGSGIWMSFEKEVKNWSGQVVATPLTSATHTFNANTAHSCKVGITWDGAKGWQNANNPNNQDDKKLISAHYKPPVIPTFVGLKAYKNYMTGVYFRGQTAIFKNTILADNGWSAWVAYNQIFKDSVFIGKTNNTSPAMDQYYYNKSVNNGRYRKAAIVLYDGPFEIHNSDFFDFSTTAETYNNKNSTVTPFITTGGTNKFINVVSGLRFDPEPLYRAHLQDKTENTGSLQYLGNAIIRDLDGSLSGTGVNSVVVAKRSLGIMPETRCQNGGDSLYNFKVCPGDYTEGSFTFLRWGWSAWATPFVVLRSDGKTSYPIDEWNYVYGNNNLFATANSYSYTYELLPRFQYANDKLLSAKTSVDANTESLNPIIPVVKIIAYGFNCKLHQGALRVNSIQELYQQTSTAYYSSGEDFYVRVIPKDKWAVIENDPNVHATALSTISGAGRYQITCDDTDPIPKRVIGKIESVMHSETHTTISGWACNYTDPNSIKVNVYAKTSPRFLPAHQSMQFITQVTSNLSPDARVSFNCGYLSNQGKRFIVQIPKTDLLRYKDHTFYLKGLSNSNGADNFLIDSGKYSVLPRTLDMMNHHEKRENQYDQ